MLCMNIVGVEGEATSTISGRRRMFPRHDANDSYGPAKVGRSKEQMLKPEMNIISRHLLPSTHGYIFYLLLQPRPKEDRTHSAKCASERYAKTEDGGDKGFSSKKAKEQATVESVIGKVEEGLGVSLRLGNNLWQYGLRWCRQADEENKRRMAKETGTKRFHLKYGIIAHHLKDTFHPVNYF